MIERTLIIIKPDAIQRRLAGRILQRIEDKGLRIAALHMLLLSPEQAREMYSPHEGKDFYVPLLKYITSSPVIAMVVTGPVAINVIRTMAGPTFGPDAPPGTIRGDFGESRRFNLIHASDCKESATREIPIFFEDSELIDYSISLDQWEYTDIDRI